MRLRFVAASCACVSLAACGGWKSGQANSAQGNISQDSRPPATGRASAVTNAAATNGMATNAMVMLAVPLAKNQALHVMQVRHEGMETIGKNMKVLTRQVTGGSPDTGVVRASAAQIANLSRQASGWFPAGTGPNVGKTGAKPDIWQNPQDFSAKLHNFQLAAQAFNAAAASGDTNAIRAKFADLGGACKACHDKYRSEMHH